MSPEEEFRRLRGRFLQAADGSFFWAPELDAPQPPPEPIEGQLLRPIGQEEVFGFDGSHVDAHVVRTVRPARWVDAFTGVAARGEPR